MSEDLLAKEREFHRLNRELGRKTKDLMREVDSVLISHSTSLFPTRVNDSRDADYYRAGPIALHAKKSRTAAEPDPRSNSEGYHRCGFIIHECPCKLLITYYFY